LQASENEEASAFSCLKIATALPTLCLKMDPDIIDRNFKINHRILIIFSTNMPNTSAH